IGSAIPWPSSNIGPMRDAAAWWTWRCRPTQTPICWNDWANTRSACGASCATDPARRASIRGFVLNLTGGEQPSRLDMTLPGWSAAGHSLQVAQGTLSAEDAGQPLARIAGGELERWVLPWLPLLRGAAEPANIAEWKRLASQEPDSRTRYEL